MKHLRTFSKFEINEGIFSSDFKSLSKSIKDKARSLLNFKKPHQPEMRIPEKISKEELDKKYFNFGRVPFTKKEIEFLKKFGEKNKEDYHIDIKDGKSHMGEPISKFVRNMLNTQIDEAGNFLIIRNIGGDIVRHIHLVKLDDEWYLIYDTIKGRLQTNRMNLEYYLCDQWEEVLGYLSDNGFNI